MESKPVVDETTEDILQKWLSMSKEQAEPIDEMTMPVASNEYDYHNEYLEEMRKQNVTAQELLGEIKKFNRNFATLVGFIGIGIIYMFNKK